MAAKYNGQIKAIETVYRGYRFRSRLEARWAVFFDALGIKWEYEKEGFEFGDGTRYLPDFWLEGESDPYWIEIKAHKDLSNEEVHKALKMSEHFPGFILMGYPELPVYKGEHCPPGYQLDHSLYVGSWAVSFAKWKFTENDTESVMLAADLQHQQRLFCWHERKDGSFLLWPVPAWEPILTKDPKGMMERLIDGWITEDDMIDCSPIGKTKWIDSLTLRKAYDSARQARFEHGEQGKPRNGKI